jgi:hypothetical protein
MATEALQKDTKEHLKYVYVMKCEAKNKIINDSLVDISRFVYFHK